jgi:hypothetical protein
MRGPLLSGAIGSPAALERLCQILRAQPPAVVLSSLWLATELSSELPVLVMAEKDAAKAARRAARKAAQTSRRLQSVLAAEAVPLARGTVGALVLENLAEIGEGETVPFLLGLVPALRPDGVIVALDRVKDPVTEARLAGAFLAGGLMSIAQERPREGALFTIARAPLPQVLSVLATAEAQG